MITKSVTPTKRINSIDALRGFALFGILMFHCMEHFDLMHIPELETIFWQKVDNVVFEAITFLFAGKSYAIFSLLFGLSFFMQMDSQADRNVDFRWRFLWRLALLLMIGYINGLMYMGEFFVVYAILGVVMVPLFKVPTKWLIAIAAILFLQIPEMVNFISLLSGNSPNQPPYSVVYMNELYKESTETFTNGSFADVIQFNTWKGQFSKLLWVWTSLRYPQLIGLFITGMLIGRTGVHKSEEKLVKYSKKVLPYTIGLFVVLYSIYTYLPYFGIEGYALSAGSILFKTYANLAMMSMYVCGFMLLYYKTSARVMLNRIAPVGRMSVTNYMAQSFIGVPLFYGFGLNLALEFTLLQCMLVGFAIYAIQVLYSNWWMNRYYYGPVEWLWRTATWFKKFPLKRK